MFPNELAGLEVGFDTLPTKINVAKAYIHLTTMAKDATIDTQAAIGLQQEASRLPFHRPNTNGRITYFQKKLHLFYQLRYIRVDKD